MFIAEHIIQRQILKELVKGEQRRFSDIKPKNIESNLFLYHLRQLTSAGFINKLPDGSYTLTKVGRQYADRSNLESMRQRLQPKQITILVLSSKSGKYVILKRNHVPYMDYSGFPSGKIHYGETLQEAAHRELKEKTGLPDTPLTLRGNFLMRFFNTKTGEIESHINAYIFTGSTADKTFIHKDEFFETYLSEEKELFGEKSFKGHKEILEKLKTAKGYFIEDISFESKF